MKRVRVSFWVMFFFGLLFSSCGGNEGSNSLATSHTKVPFADEVRLAHKYQEGDVVFLGDERLRCCNWQGVIQGVRIVNSAVGNHSIQEELSVLHERFGGSTPSKIVLMLGYAELDAGVAANEVFDLYAKYVEGLQELLPQTEIVTITQLPVGCFLKYGNSKVTNEVLDAYNVLVKVHAQEKGCTVVDLNRDFKNENGFLKSEYDASDGFHLYSRAYEVWAYRLNGILN